MKRLYVVLVTMMLSLVYSAQLLSVSYGCSFSGAGISCQSRCWGAGCCGWSCGKFVCNEGNVRIKNTSEYPVELIKGGDFNTKILLNPGQETSQRFAGSSSILCSTTDEGFVDCSKYVTITHSNACDTSGDRSLDLDDHKADCYHQTFC
jgi:hypothetical protein